MTAVRADYEAQSGRKRFFSILEEEMKMLLDPETRELRAGWAEQTACYLCGSNREEELFRKTGLRFVRFIFSSSMKGRWAECCARKAARAGRESAGQRSGRTDHP
jgi:Flp pilus assembly protein TadB